jgi:LruC domain-containing protein
MMKGVRFAVIIAAIVALAGCNLGVQSPLIGSSDLSMTQAELPPDIVNDIVRAEPVEFAFESYVAIDLALNVALYDTAFREDPDSRLASRTGDTQTDVVVSIRDQDGALIYRGSVADGRLLDGSLTIPTAVESLTVRFDAPGYESRLLKIDGPADLQKIDRDIMMRAIDPNSGPLLVIDPADLIDADGDGISVVYDADDNDPNVAFINRNPATGYLTVAYEDNFPDIGDGDYNDFKASYFTEEVLNAWNRLVEIRGSATALARAAGYDHEFGLYIEFPDVTAELTVTRRDYQLQAIGSPESTTVDGSARIVFFESTKAAFYRPPDAPNMLDNGYPDQQTSIGYTTDFVLELPSISLITTPISSAPYDPYLFILDTEPQYDVHLIGQKCLPGSSNPPDTDGFRDENGFPRALLVPSDWAHPIEVTSILDAYPDFQAWVDSRGQTGQTWYLNPDSTKIVEAP